MKKIIEFDSGLKLVYVKNDAVRSVALGVYVGAGVLTEDMNTAGISHFIEHMMFKGTKTRTSFEIVNEIDSVGAQINAFTTKSCTCYYTVSLDHNADKCLDILSDMYFNPLFDDDELKKERNVIVEEINESEDTPDDVCLEKLSEVYFAGHKLANPILGTKDSISMFDSKTLFEYKNRWYVPENTIISIAGNVCEQDAVELVQRHFEDKFLQSPVKAVFKKQDVAVATPCSGVAKTSKDIEQSHIAFAFPSLSYEDPKSIVVQLMTTVFGLEMSSRLFQSVREKLGLCYTIIAYPSTYQNNGLFVIFTSTNPVSVEKTVLAIKNEIKLLLDQGITEDELCKGKEQMKTSLVLGQESTTSMMRAFGRHAMQTGELYDIDSRIESIDNVTCADVLEVAKQIFDFDKVAGSLVSKSVDVDIVELIKKK